MQASALASQNYWQRILANVALGPKSPYNKSRGFQWLSNPKTVKEATSTLAGVAGVAAGHYQNFNAYAAFKIDKNTSDPNQPKNKDFMYNLPAVRVCLCWSWVWQGERHWDS